MSLGEDMTLRQKQGNPSLAGVHVREFVSGTELLNRRSSQSVVTTLRVQGDDLLTHLFRIGASAARSVAMISDTSAIRRSVSSIHDGGGFLMVPP